MKQKKSNSSSIIWIVVICLAILTGAIIYYVNFYGDSEANFTIVDNSTGDNRVKDIGTYGLREHVIVLEDRTTTDYCYATIWFTEQQTSGTLKIDLYIDSMTIGTSIDLGLLGDTGLLYEWSNFTKTILRDEWVSITIEYDNTYNKGTLSINGVALGTQHNFISNPDYITGFYLRTDPSGAVMMHIDIVDVK